jgi:hypothetical protein
MEFIAWSLTVGVGIGTGLGAALGTGWVVFQKRVLPARIQALQQLDATFRESTMGELKASLDRNERFTRAYHELSQRLDKLEEEFAALKAEVEGKGPLSS